jgi:hypothetical protein
VRLQLDWFDDRLARRMARVAGKPARAIFGRSFFTFTLTTYQFLMTSPTKVSKG